MSSIPFLDLRKYIVLACIAIAVTGGVCKPAGGAPRPGVTATVPSAAKGFLRANGKKIVDQKGNEVLLRGMNIGNWLEPEGYMLKIENSYYTTRLNAFVLKYYGEEKAREFWKKYRENYVTEADIREIARLGFNHIRIPFHYALFEESAQGEGFRVVDRVINWCEKYNVYVVLDMHCAPGGQTGTGIDDAVWGSGAFWSNERNRLEAVRIWRSIAAHYRDSYIILGYDLLNEPLDEGFSRTHKDSLTELSRFYKAAVAAIRLEDKRHIVFLEGACSSTDFSMLEQPLDANMVYSFHKYWNINDPDSIQEYLSLSSRQNVPLWCGETGENIDHWYYDCTRLLESRRIGWCFWTWKKVDCWKGVYSIKRPSGYDTVIAATKGTANPPPELVRRSLDELLENMLLKNCSFNDRNIRSLFGEDPYKQQPADPVVDMPVQKE